MFFCLNIVGAAGYAVTSSSVAAGLKLNTAQLGSLGGAYLISYAVSQLILGAAMDAISPRMLLGVTALISAVGAFLLSVATNFEMALIARILMGFGFGTAMVGVVYVVSKQFSDRYAFMVNLSQSLANAAGATFGSIASLPVMQNFRGPFFATSILLAINAILIFLFIKDDNSEKSESSPSESLAIQLKTILSNGQYWLGTLYFTGLFSAFLAYSDLWDIRFQIDVFGHQTAVAAMLNSGMIWGLTVGGVLIGLWANKVGYLLPARICSLTALIMLIILYSRPLPNVFIVPLIILGVTMGSAPLGLAVANAHLPVKMQTLGSPILLTVVFVAGGLLMSQIGVTLAAMTQHNFDYYRAGMNWLIIPVAIAFTSSLFIKEKRA